MILICLKIKEQQYVNEFSFYISSGIVIGICFYEIETAGTDWHVTHRNSTGALRAESAGTVATLCFGSFVVMQLT